MSHRRPSAARSLIEGLELRRLFAVGALDPTFASAGKRAIDFGGVIDELSDVAVQADGKIVAVGSKTATSTYGTGGDFAVVRLLATGQPDPSFGTNGLRLYDFGGQVERANAVVIQPDGKIIVGGSTHATTDDYWGDWVLFRLNANDGSLDTTFGGGTGRVVTSFGTDDELYDLALQPDGKIVAGGMATPSANGLGLARYLSDGTLDSTFDGDGKLTSTKLSEISSIAIGNDGKITTLSGTGLGRFLPSGAFDTTFGTGTTAGQGYTIDPGVPRIADSMALAPDGGVYEVSTSVDTSKTPATWTNILRRFSPTGALVTTFGSAGIVTIGAGESTAGAGLIVQPNGSVIFTVTSASTTDSHPYGTTTIARVSSTGVYDSTFGTNGKLVLPEGSNASGAALDSAGRIVVIASTGWDSEILRVTTEGAGSVTGRLVNDVDGDTIIDPEDTPMGAGITVFIDNDFDRVLDPGERTTLTDANGRFRFDGLPLTNPPGGYPIAAKFPTGYGSRGGYQASVSSATTPLALGDWAVFNGFSQYGQVFNDVSGDGVQQAGETGLSGFQIYNDANQNGVRDTGEISVTTNANGNYSIAVPTFGTLRMLSPIGYRQTYPKADDAQYPFGSPGSASVSNLNFGAIASTFAATGTYDRDLRQVIYTFDRAVRSNAISFSLKNLDTNQTYTVANALGFINDPKKLAFEPVLIGVSGSPTLPDGHYRATLAAGSVRDSSGNVLPTPQVVTFNFIQGDANGDGHVNFDDLVILAQNYNQTGKTYSQGNFTYGSDGVINFDDLVLLAQNYNKTLATIVAPALELTATKKSTPRATAVSRLEI